MNHAAYDLGALASALRRHKKFRAVAQAINDALDINSAYADLIYARDAVAELEREQYLPEIVKSALTSHAITLYARATKTKSDARKTFDIRKRMTDEQREDHKQICDLRDAYTAHFGAGGSYDGVNLVRETLYMKPVPNDVKFGVISRRINDDPNLTRRLSKQIDATIAIYEKVSEVKQEDVVAQMVLFSNDPENVSILDRYPFDAFEFFGSPEEALAFYGAPIEPLRRSQSPLIVGNAERWLPDRD